MAAPKVPRYIFCCHRIIRSYRLNISGRRFLPARRHLVPGWSVPILDELQADLNHSRFQPIPGCRVKASLHRGAKLMTVLIYYQPLRLRPG
jgi:hypothetical protein